MSGEQGRTAARIVARASRAAVRAPRSHWLPEEPISARVLEPSLPGPVGPSPPLSETERPRDTTARLSDREQEARAHSPASPERAPQLIPETPDVPTGEGSRSEADRRPPEVQEAASAPARRDEPASIPAARISRARPAAPVAASERGAEAIARRREPLAVPTPDVPTSTERGTAERSGNRFSVEAPPSRDIPLPPPPRNVPPPAPAGVAQGSQVAAPSAAATPPAPNVVIDQILIVTPPAAPREADPFASLGPRRVGASRHGRGPR